MSSTRNPTKRFERSQSPPSAEARSPEKDRHKESMSSWLQQTASSSQARFAATALVSGVVVAGAIFGYQHVRRQERVEDLKSSIPELGREHKANKVRCNSWTRALEEDMKQAALGLQVEMC